MSDAAGPLILTRLSIRKMAGVQSEFALGDLSPGVNVIYGPNGVGKSRAALALNMALWPGKLPDARRDAVSAWFDLAGESWAVTVDADEVCHQRAGTNADAPALPPAENRDRYNLPLGELLADHGESFARAIGRESAGGYDLSAATVALEIEKRPQSRITPITHAVRQSADSVRERQRKLGELRKSEEDLQELAARLDECRRAVARLPRLRAALDLNDAVNAKANAEERLLSFPPAISRLTGKEPEQLEQLRLDIAGKSQAIEKAEQDLGRAQAALTATQLSQHPPDETTLSALADLSRRLAEQGNGIAALELESKSADARRQKAMAAVGSNADNAKLQQLDVKGLADLAVFSREAEKARASLVAVETVQQWLNGALPTPPGEELPDDAGRLEEGLRLLSQWLRQPAEPAPALAEIANADWVVPLAAGLIVLLSLLLAWRWHWAAGIIALAGPAIYFLWTRRQISPPAVNDARPIFQQQYASLRLGPPARWTIDDVEQTSRALWDQLSAAKLRKERADRLAEQQPRIAGAQRQWQIVEQQRQQIIERLGVAPRTDESVLHMLVDAILRWQQADADVAATTAKLQSAAAQRQQTLAAAMKLLAPFGYEISDSTALDASRENLRQRFDQYRKSAADISRLNVQITELQQQNGKLAERVAALFTACGLNENDDATLQQWIEQRGEYARCKTAFEIASAKVADAGELLHREPELRQLSREELEKELGDCSDLSADEPSLIEKITTIKTQLNAARQASDLEEAQAQYREAAAVLAGARAQDCETAAGWVLQQHLRKVSRQRHQSAVFRGAREIFARVTRGRYRLEFDDVSKIPEFRCIDTQSGLGQSLDELSSGTRLQLLLAVRVAFVEQQETSPRLPLILDETLANSDETRARQILDSLIEICRGGRQVFYFTAQPDEVGKWREVLDSQPSQGAVAYKLIDLAKVRGLAESERTPARQMVTAPPTLVPPPDGLSRQEYGRLLQVPGVDPRAATAGALHLWHLIDDLPALHSLLAMGIATWGQWKTMAEVGGLETAGASALFARADARARLIESLARAWGIGRGKPVDRQAIADSKAVTSTFLDAVVQLAAVEIGDARKLIARLEDRAVTGFRAAKIESLKSWLRETGHLDPRPIMSIDEMRLGAIGLMQKEITSGLLAVAQIDELLATWFSDRPGERSVEAEKEAEAEPTGGASLEPQIAE